MSDPEFKVGDKVEIEVLADGEPRWNFYGNQWQDMSCPNNPVKGYVEGTVIQVQFTHIRCNFKFAKDKGLGFGYPINNGADTYSPDQWQRPGWVRHKIVGKVEESSPEQVTKRECTCPSEQLSIFSADFRGCTCGAINK